MSDNRWRFFGVAVSTLLCVTLLISGCSGSGGSGSGDDSATPGSVGDISQSSLETVNRVLGFLWFDTAAVPGQSSALGRALASPDGLRGRQEQEVDACVGGGQVTFSGMFDGSGSDDNLSFAYTGTIAFENCEGRDGMVDIAMTGTSSDNTGNVDMSITLNGSITDTVEGCQITLSAFTVDLSIAGETETATVTMHGTINASCDGETVACTLNNVDMNDEDGFEDSCVLS